MNARKPASPDMLALFSIVVKTLEQRKTWNLARREERADFERRAYFPRIDYGEDAPLRPGFHEDGEQGWMD
jgi:hypothetical protein